MVAAAEAIMTLLQSGRGNRPYSLDDVEVENVLNIALALLVELGVANDRIDRLERVVADLSAMPVEHLRDIRYEDAVAEERQGALDALLARVLRILIDPRRPTDARPTRGTGG